MSDGVRLGILNVSSDGAVVDSAGVAKQVQRCFQKLSSCPLGPEQAPPSSFRFCWGDEDGADGPSLHHQRLDGVPTLKRSATYWHPPLKLCRYTYVKRRMKMVGQTPPDLHDLLVCSSVSRCRSHFLEAEPTLPRSFVWLLQLFCFLLDLNPACVYEEVLHLERALFTTGRAKRRWPRRGRPRPRRAPTSGQKDPADA